MINKLAKVLMQEWEDAGSNGFFMDYFAKRTGYDFGTVQYTKVYELVIEGKI